MTFQFCGALPGALLLLVVAGCSSSGADARPAVRLPACLTDLFASCRAEGACTFVAGDGGGPAAVCYASGVSAAFTPVAMGMLTVCNARTAEVRRADGSLCYTFEAYDLQSTACEMEYFTWRDDTGATVAGASRSSNGELHVTCSGANDQAVRCRPPGECCDLTDIGTAACGTWIPRDCTQATCP